MPPAVAFVEGTYVRTGWLLLHTQQVACCCVPAQSGYVTATTGTTGRCWSLLVALPSAKLVLGLLLLCVPAVYVQVCPLVEQLSSMQSMAVR